MKLAIAGLGLIGASIGLRGRRFGWNVTGYDPSVAALDEAMARGALDARAASFDELLRGRDLAVLAAPVDKLPAILAQMGAWNAAGGTLPRLIIDVGSVKAPVVRAAAGIPGFIGTHPLAGSTRSGPAGALGSLFHGRPWAYVPTEDALACERLLEFIKAMGARPVPIGAEEHDRIVALTSHLPQTLSIVLATFLGESAAATQVRALAGPGLESMTRLAQSPFPMWRGIYAENGHNLVAALKAVASLIESLVESGDGVDATILEQYFTQANAFAETVFEGSVSE